MSAMRHKDREETSVLVGLVPRIAPQNSRFQAEMNSEVSENGVEALGISQGQTSLRFNVHLGELGNRSLLGKNSIQNFHDNTSFSGIGETASTGEVYASRSLMLERREDSNDDKVGLLSSTLDDVRSIIDGDESDGLENTVDSSSTFLSNIETDPLIWTPPAPVDIGEDVESVANNDDDDDYSDGTKWGQPSCLSGLDADHGSTFKEEREKAIMEAMNGQFKILVSRFLASEGVTLFDGGCGGSWLDIVASLSWEAALLIKPEASEGMAMDPASYVKVKCIATGARGQSQVIKGLVFKKNTAHKHMPTKCKNPGLLLLQGVLGHREVGLSSFDSMDQENDYLKSINEMIDACRPNVVLVEKSVSRDVQEYLLSKGMTLVFDMKLTRLNRIARCIGSPIISAVDILGNPKIKQCDSFHVEKFVEEHNSTCEGGKKSNKTLMFLEGFPKPLGCTILLKGAHIDELKKVKRVVQYTVFAAYHLILETSFFSDQRALFSNMHAISEGNTSLTDNMVSLTSCGAASDLNTSSLDGSIHVLAQAYSVESPISNGSLENSAHEAMDSHPDPNVNGSSQSPLLSPHSDCNEHNLMYSDLFFDRFSRNIIKSDSSILPDFPKQLMSLFSMPLKRFLSDSFTPVTSDSLSSYFGFKEDDLDIQSVSVLPVSPSLGTLGHDAEGNHSFNQEKPHDENRKTEKDGPLPSLDGSTEHCNGDVNGTVEMMQNKDSVDSVWNPQSILVLLSSQCIAKGVACEQSHLSRIKYYGNFDVSLGRFLQEILLNQKHSCSSCGEPPEAHVYCYTHQNGNLTVLVRQLPSELSLSGEAEGKIWMWTRCLKCEHESGILKSTERVVMSTAARSLSFGKFLELSFSSHSAASRLPSKCGHSLHRDCLRFFGLGSKVAMFRYSALEIYATCKPPPVLEFFSPNGREWLKREVRSVLRKGDLIFLEVANLLQKMKPGDACSLAKRSIKFPGSIKDFREVEEMLIKEKAEFEASLLKAVNDGGQLGKPVNANLGLSWLNQELLFELYIWDRRLHSLVQHKKYYDAPDGEILPEQCLEDNAMPCNKYVEGNMSDGGAVSSESRSQNPMNVEETCSSSYTCHAQNNSRVEPLEEVQSAEISENVNMETSSIRDNESMTKEENSSTMDIDPCTEQSELSSRCLTNNDRQEECEHSSNHDQVDHSTAVSAEQFGATEKVTELEHKSERMMIDGENSTVILSEKSCRSKLEDPEEWIWAPASELQRAFRMDFHGGYLQKFEFIRNYIPAYLSPMHQDRDSLHFPVGVDGNVISVCEDEISSIIASALALSDEKYGLLENFDEKDTLEGKEESDKLIDNSHNSLFDGSVASSFWSSTGSSDSEGMHPSRSFSSLSSDELSTSGYEGFDRLVASENVHPEIPVGIRKTDARGKYSVVCIYAKQFYALRRMCCPSEIAYISSLSRCKKWDAQGGKSKAFFAKTLDDRFIVKQVKKTEIDSFLKFAPDYFRHVSYSISSGSQTCLAKILGIYQVRQNRGGKEVKIDLMVMENLLFGHNVARTYDLKGAVFSRYISDANDHEKVFLDQNFVEDMRVSPMYIGGRAKQLLQRAIWNDTSFLTSINVMDYSLLVGVDKQRHELVFGIIDYLRQYTWDKQLETWVKASLVVPRNSLPTVISPKEYKKRFRKFMSKYFLTVPDSWSFDHCSGPRNACIDGECISSNIHSGKLPEQSNHVNSNP